MFRSFFKKFFFVSILGLGKIVYQGLGKIVYWGGLLVDA